MQISILAYRPHLVSSQVLTLYLHSDYQNNYCEQHLHALLLTLELLAALAIKTSYFDMYKFSTFKEVARRLFPHMFYHQYSTLLCLQSDVCQTCFK